ncbi:thiamine diphosphokinase [Pseudobutyrivibrio xylanivorans]|uniref:Thiamine diphosphokinase n=1 Tax=Pseudobutyrivibrio xylanivorans DSM 14809 TaxID=1123012 RepID=A0A1M6INI4_PSEXY|nr:thiamine diphosphokinase [Pseudobutyrivibrio xylanivorans]SHJ35967.1 thiamine pyrophosphokinase [Pseudobutyrivibrio xylanivorans DSM 14809]
MIVVIIAGGNIDEKFIGGFIEDLDESSLFLIACDKGYEACERMGIKPDVLIGDFDSASGDVSGSAEKAGVQVIRLNPVKDDTDTEAALDLAIKKTTEEDEIFLLGVTGTRIDHVLGNISLVGKGLLADREVTMLDSHNSIQMIKPGETYIVEKDYQFGKYISVFPYMGPVKGLNMTGFKYPVKDGEIHGFSTLTVSNELAEDEGVITIEEGTLIVIESLD